MLRGEQPGTMLHLGSSKLGELMATRNLSIATIGWPAIATGVAVILAAIFLILMFRVSISFGTVNDILNSPIGLSSAVLAWILYAEHRVYSQNSPDFYRCQNTEVN
jgi:hypothetical protein